MSDIGFRMMAFDFKIRDFLRPRRDIVKEVGMKKGFHVLDYGCGSGSYVPAVAELVGKSGKNSCRMWKQFFLIVILDCPMTA
jgi:ubiquinone/menaquinone biosynthesis C-methylase UbiE